MKVKVEKVRAESAIDELATKRKAIEEYLISIGMSPEEAKAKALEQVPAPVQEVSAPVADTPDVSAAAPADAPAE